MNKFFRQLGTTVSVLTVASVSWAAVPTPASPHATSAVSKPAVPGILPVVIYTAPTCSWCTKVKALFDEKKIPAKIIDVTRDPKAYQEMQDKTSKTTVPQIFIGGKHIGSYMAVAWLSDEDFDKLLRGQETSS